MAANIARLALLAVFSGMAVNLILHLGISIKGIAFDPQIERNSLLSGCAIIFASVMLLWLFFYLARSLFFLGFMEYVVLFPLSVVVYSGLEYAANRFILKKKPAWQNEYGRTLGGGPFNGGALSGAALFVMLNGAGGVLDALALALGFSGSVALVFVVVSEIRRRSKMEPVPHRLRGGPLALIALGLLSLVFSSGALMIFGALGGR